MQSLSRLLHGRRQLFTNELARGLWFLGIGGTVALFNLTLVWLFSHQHTLPYIAYIVIVTECSILVSFCLNDRLTFRSLAIHRASWIARCLRFHSVGAFGALFTIGLSATIFHFTHWAPTKAQAAAIICATAVNFLSHRFWTYRKPRLALVTPDAKPDVVIVSTDGNAVGGRFD